MDSPGHPSAVTPLRESAPVAPLWPLATVAIVYAGLDFLAIPFVWIAPESLSDEVAVAIILPGVGLFLSQFGILPVWLALGSRPFWQRLMIHWGLASGLILCWLLGMLLVRVQSDAFPPAEFFWREMASTLLCLPAVSLGIEGPLWLARHVFNWRLKPSATCPPQAPLAIRDFFWGTGMVAVALGCLRAAAGLLGPWRESELWIGVGITVAVASLASALVLLPFAWCMLRWNRVGVGVLAIIVYTLLWGVVILSIVIATAGPIPDPLFAPGLFWFLACFAASIAAAMGLMRRAGYRLEVGRRQAPATEAE